MNGAATVDRRRICASAGACSGAFPAGFLCGRTIMAGHRHWHSRLGLSNTKTNINDQQKGLQHPAPANRQPVTRKNPMNQRPSKRDMRESFVLHAKSSGPDFAAPWGICIRQANASRCTGHPALTRPTPPPSLHPPPSTLTLMTSCPNPQPSTLNPQPRRVPKPLPCLGCGKGTKNSFDCTLRHPMVWHIFHPFLPSTFCRLQSCSTSPGCCFRRNALHPRPVRSKEAAEANQ